MGTIIDFEEGTDAIGLRERYAIGGLRERYAIGLAGGSQGLDTWINFEGETLATLQGIDSTLINDDVTVVN